MMGDSMASLPKLLVALAFILPSLLLVSQQTEVEHVGKLPDGSFLLNSGWVIHPVGTQVDVDTFPMRSVLSPDGKYLLVLNGGYNPPSISVIDVASRRELHRTRVPDAWMGLVFAPDGKTLYVGGASKARVYHFNFNPQTGELSASGEFAAVNDPNSPGHSFIGDVAVSPDGHLLYAADLLENQIAVINLQSGRLIERWKCGRRPYRILILPGGKQFLVSSWADASLYQYDATTGTQVVQIRVAPHPTDLFWLNKPASTDDSDRVTYSARLFVAAANTNNVYVYGVTAAGEFNKLEVINTSLTPLQPLGMTPSAVTTDAAGKRLYITCSDANTVAVVDISQPLSRILGFIPAGWYPTGATALADGTLAILNGKGKGSFSNVHGPNPLLRPEQAYQGSPVTEYVAHMQTGTVQFVPTADDQQLRTYTNTVMRGSAYSSDQLRDTFRGGNVNSFVKAPDRGSPIQHVVYVIKENRTYDQVLGDMPKGNGDKSLTIFGEDVTPNLHKLASEYVLYDNFYENADVSAEGHNWAAAAIAPDYTVKMWPNSYAGRRKHYDYEGGEPANLPPAGYIWTNALAAGVKLRNYGEWVTNAPLHEVQNDQQVKEVRDPALRPVTDMNYRGFDLNYPDLDRTREFLREWKGYDEKGEAPQLAIVRLGNDHTSGLAAGKIAPRSSVADNDYAVGQLVEGVSHSKFWASTAIFIIEDDAQNGPDHVDSHRAPAFIISPFTRRGAVDSTMYNQTSILRTMEGILGLRPMTQFDAAAVTMFGSFKLQPDATPYTVEKPRISLTDRNPAKGAGAVASAKMDFDEADDIDDNALNAILWRALKDTDVPAPTRSLFSSR
jgi:DNA-binding beta-propeller fold protein YncE